MKPWYQFDVLVSYFNVPGADRDASGRASMSAYTTGRGRALSIHNSVMVGAAAWAILGVSAPALAATPTIETIVVTAEKRSEDITKVPTTVHALAGDELERLGVRDVKSALVFIPGASLSGET